MAVNHQICLVIGKITQKFCPKFGKIARIGVYCIARNFCSKFCNLARKILHWPRFLASASYAYEATRKEYRDEGASAQNVIKTTAILKHSKKLNNRARLLFVIVQG